METTKSAIANQGSGALSEKLQQQNKAILGANILVAEDNINNQLLMRKYLQICGLNCEIANNGSEAISLINKYNFDLILMDIYMPEMDGLEATKFIRKQEKFKDLPIIALTAEGTTKERLISLAAGMNDFVTKPIEITTLNRILGFWIKPKKEITTPVIAISEIATTGVATTVSYYNNNNYQNIN